MILILLAVVLFAWKENIDWQIKQPDHAHEVDSLLRQRKNIKRWIYVLCVLFLVFKIGEAIL